MNAELERDGWTVLRFWETDLKRDPASVAQKIAEQVEAKRR